MDFATVVVQVGALQLRATRDRGVTGWEIGSSGSQPDWQPLDAVCARYSPEQSGNAFEILSRHFAAIEGEDIG